MNKAELVEALAQHYDGSKAEAARALNVVVHTISASAAAGEKVSITGFGVFEKVERPARTVRNPRTGERLDVPASAVPRFRAGTELKAYVAGTRPVPEMAAAPVPVRRSSSASSATSAPVAEADDVASQAGSKSSAEAKPSGKKSSDKASGQKASAKKSDAKSAKKASAKKSSKKSPNKKGKKS